MHGKFVPMTADVKALWVSNTGKSFSLLGFTERKTILEVISCKLFPSTTLTYARAAAFAERWRITLCCS